MLPPLKKKNKYSGFTIIELLVVIAIMGLLSSIILANIATAREKARIAAGQLNDGSGSVAHAELGQIDGTITNPSWVEGIHGGKALSFASSGDVDVPNSTSFPDYSTELSISVWVKLTSTPGAWAPITYKDDTPRSWWFGFVPNTTNSIHWSHGGLSSNDLTCTIPNALNTWRHIFVTYKQGVGRKMYVDGNLICSDTSFGLIPITTSDIHIGGPGWSNLPGVLQDLRIYAGVPQ